MVRGPYRAVSKDTGKMVDGFLFEQTNHPCVGPEKKKSYILQDDMYDWGLPKVEAYEVYPDTIQRYIGCKDINQREICEGDKVRVDDLDEGVITYMPDIGAWCVMFDAEEDYWASLLSLTTYYPRNTIEIIEERGEER